MNAKTHLVGGALFGGITSLLVNGPCVSLGTIVLTSVSTLSSLLPDIDHKNSTVSKDMGTVNKVVSGTVRAFTTHRGVIHTPLLLGLFCVAAQKFCVGVLGCSVAVVYGLIAGFLSHLVLDTFNPTGIKWFFPLKARIHIARIKTGSKAEKIFRLMLLGGCCFILIYLLLNIKQSLNLQTFLSYETRRTLSSVVNEWLTQLLAKAKYLYQTNIAKGSSIL